MYLNKVDKSSLRNFVTSGSYSQLLSLGTKGRNCRPIYIYAYIHETVMPMKTQKVWYRLML